MIPNGNFATCPILARTTSWNHWEMGKEVVNFGAALDARVMPSFSTENWRNEHRTQSSIIPFRDLDFVLTMSFNLTVTLKQVPAFILLIWTPVLHHFTILCLICLNAYIMWLKQAYCVFDYWAQLNITLINFQRMKSHSMCYTPFYFEPETKRQLIGINWFLALQQNQKYYLFYSTFFHLVKTWRPHCPQCTWQVGQRYRVFDNGSLVNLLLSHSHTDFSTAPNDSDSSDITQGNFLDIHPQKALHNSVHICSSTTQDHKRTLIHTISGVPL